MTTNSLQSMDRQPDASAYQWLEESLRRMSTLQKDSHPQQYGEELKNLVKESVQRLKSSDASDLLLQINLRLLAAEALIDLALVEEDANQRSGYLQSGRQHCRQIIDLLKTQPVSGLACETLPRLITLLACASQAAAEQNRQPLLDDLLAAVDLLERFLDQQANERQQAGDELLRGQVYVSSRPALGDDTQAWRMVLEQAADCVRRAGALAYRAFDFELFNHSQESLAEIEKMLATARQAAPVPAVSTRVQSTAAKPEAPKKSRGRLLLGVGGLLLSCLLSLFSLIPLLQGFGLLGKYSAVLPAFLAGQPTPTVEAAVQPAKPTQAAKKPTPTIQEESLPTAEQLIPDDRLVAKVNLPRLALTNDELPEGWSVEEDPYSGSTNLSWGGEDLLAYLDSVGRITDVTFWYNPPGNICDLTSRPLIVIINTHLFKDSAGAGDFFRTQSDPGESEPRIGKQSSYRAFTDKKGFREDCNAVSTGHVFWSQRFNTVTEIIMPALDDAMSEQEAKTLILDLGKKVDERILSVAE